MSEVAVLPAREDGYTRKKWNMSEYGALHDLGLLEPNHYQLVKGEVVCRQTVGANPFALPPLEDGYARRKWSMLDCRAMLESGLFDLERCELLEGEILSKMGQGFVHGACKMCAWNALSAIFGIMSLPLHMGVGIGAREDYSEPQPDIALVRGTIGDYLQREPKIETDILLVAEVADSTLYGDVVIKSPIYARNGLREYWVLAIPRRQLIVHRAPTAHGYMDVQTHSDADSISPLAAPHASVRVADMLPPAKPA